MPCCEERLMIRPRASATGSWREHLLDGALAAQEDAAQPDVHDRVPVVLGRLEEPLRVRAGHDRIVDHHVQPTAPVDGGARRAGRCRPTRPASAVNEDGAPAGVSDQLDGRPAALARVLAHVADHDVGALGGEGQRHRPAEAGRPAGDDDRLAGEPVAQLRSPFARPPSTSTVMPFRYAARVEQRNAHSVADLGRVAEPPRRDQRLVAAAVAVRVGALRRRGSSSARCRCSRARWS